MIDMGAELVERDSLLVQHAVDAVPDIGLENNGCTSAPDAYIAFQAPAS